MINEAREILSGAVRIKKQPLADMPRDFRDGKTSTELNKLYQSTGTVGVESELWSLVFANKGIKRFMNKMLDRGFEEDYLKILVEEMILSVKLGLINKNPNYSSVIYNTPNIDGTITESGEKQYPLSILDLKSLFVSNIAIRGFVNRFISLDIFLKPEEEIDRFYQIIFDLITQIGGKYGSMDTWITSKQMIPMKKGEINPYTNEEELEDRDYFLITITSNQEYLELLTKDGYYTSFRTLLTDEPRDISVRDDSENYMLNQRNKVPQNCLDILNKMKSYPMELVSDIDIDEIRLAYIKQFRDKGHSPAKANDIAATYVDGLDEAIIRLSDEKIYLEPRFDFRGRIYSRGFKINFQGNTIAKGILRPHPSNFGHHEVTKDYLDLCRKGIYIGIANHRDKDKITREDQLIFGERFDYSELEESNYDRYGEDKNWLINAEKALRGIDRGEIPNILIDLDASTQGLQIYSVLMMDRISAMNSNIIGANRNDAYGKLVEALNIEMGEEIFTRKDCKKPFMITFYGSGKGAELLYQAYLDKTPDKKISANENEKLLEKISKVFWDSMKNIAPGAVMAMNTISELESLLNKDKYSWTLPDGFKVVYRVKHEKIIIPKVSWYDKLYARNRMRRLPAFNVRVYGASKNSRGLSANIIHSIDAYILRELVRRMDGEMILSIHDSFHVHPSQLDILRMKYNDILADIGGMDLLNKVLDEINPGTKIDRLNTFRTNDIPELNYSIA